MKIEVRIYLESPTGVLVRSQHTCGMFDEHYPRTSSELAEAIRRHDTADCSLALGEIVALVRETWEVPDHEEYRQAVERAREALQGIRDITKHNFEDDRVYRDMREIHRLSEEAMSKLGLTESRVGIQRIPLETERKT